MLIFVEVKCACRYEDQKKFHMYKWNQQISWSVEATVNKAYPKCNLKMPWNIFCDILTRLQPVQKSIVVYWIKPNRGTVKLNTDVSYLRAEGKAWVGGALRNENGDIIMAFSLILHMWESQFSRGICNMDWYLLVSSKWLPNSHSRAGFFLYSRYPSIGEYN